MVKFVAAERLHPKQAMEAQMCCSITDHPALGVWGGRAARDGFDSRLVVAAS